MYEYFTSVIIWAALNIANNDLLLTEVAMITVFCKTLGGTTKGCIGGHFLGLFLTALFYSELSLCFQSKPQSPKRIASLLPINNGSKENGIHEEQDQEPQDLFAGKYGLRT